MLASLSILGLDAHMLLVVTKFETKQSNIFFCDAITTKAVCEAGLWQQRNDDKDIILDGFNTRAAQCCGG